MRTRQDVFSGFTRWKTENDGQVASIIGTFLVMTNVVSFGTILTKFED